LFPRLNIIIQKGFRWYGLNGSTWYQFISDAPLGLSSGIKGKKISIIGFTLECKFRVHSLVPKIKRGDGSFNMNLEKKSQIWIQMKSIYTNQKRRQLMHIGAKMVYKQAINNSHLDNTPWLGLGSSHHFPSFSIFYD